MIRKVIVLVAPDVTVGEGDVGQRLDYVSGLCEDVVIRLAVGKGMVAEDLGQGAEGVTGNCDGAGGRLVQAVGEVDEAENTE